jgi:hypothetical protein
MIRKYKSSDYEFVLNGVISIQKQIKMANLPLISRGHRSKKEVAKKFVQTLLKPENLCFILTNEDENPIAFTCFKPINKDSCCFEFFFKIPTATMHSKIIREFFNHVKSIKPRYGFKNMYANLMERKEYDKWIYMAKKHFNAEIISQSKNKKTVILNI